jgi:hypothetical protein
VARGHEPVYRAADGPRTWHALRDSEKGERYAGWPFLVAPKARRDSAWAVLMCSC